MKMYQIKISVYAAIDGGLDGLVRSMHVIRKAPVIFHEMAVVDAGVTKEVSLTVSGEEKDVRWLVKKIEKLVDVLEVSVNEIPEEVSKIKVVV